MELVVIGLNHESAPLEIRERLAFHESDLHDALAQARSLPSVRENMILSTCNRVEVYVAASEKRKAGHELKDFFSRYHHLPLKEFERNLYCLDEEEAVRHVFRVASSLDSMVKGEPQILGQIKAAYNLATDCGTSGSLLNKLLHRAFHVAKRVRTETKISNNAVSVSFVAVELAKKIFGSLEGKIVLLVGAGEMCELAARHLVSGGVEKILVTNRTYERAVALAQEFQGEPIPFDQILQGVKRADIVISSTGASQYLLRRDQMAQILRERKQKPIFLIDMAVPRDIEPAVNDIENAYLYNMDDLQKVVNQNIQDREKEAERAEAIVSEEVVKFLRWHQSLEVTPTIVALRTRFEKIRRQELEKTFSLHPHLSDRERQSLEALTCAIINKILHEPVTLLKQSSQNGASDLYLDALQNLFKLSESPVDETAEEQSPQDRPLKSSPS
jgi:glutamyl-tRNA reductase